MSGVASGLGVCGSTLTSFAGDVQKVEQQIHSFSTESSGLGTPVWREQICSWRVQVSRSCTNLFAQNLYSCMMRTCDVFRRSPKDLPEVPRLPAAERQQMSLLRQIGALGKSRNEETMPVVWRIGFQDCDCGGRATRTEESSEDHSLRSLRQAGVEKGQRNYSPKSVSHAIVEGV